MQWGGTLICAIIACTVHATFVLEDEGRPRHCPRSRLRPCWGGVGTRSSFEVGSSSELHNSALRVS